MAPILKFDPLAFQTNLFSQIWGPCDCLYGHAFFSTIFRVKVPRYTMFQRGQLFQSFGFSFSYAIYNSIFIYAVIFMLMICLTFNESLSQECSMNRICFIHHCYVLLSARFYFLYNFFLHRGIHSGNRPNAISCVVQSHCLLSQTDLN